MIVRCFDTSRVMAHAAAAHAAAAMQRAIADTGGARIIVATGASQFEFLEELTASEVRPLWHVITISVTCALKFTAEPPGGA